MPREKQYESAAERKAASRARKKLELQLESGETVVVDAPARLMTLPPDKNGYVGIPGFPARPNDLAPSPEQLAKLGLK